MLVIKIGGKPAADLGTLDYLLQDIAQIQRQGQACVLVHGGGADVSELSRKLGIEPVFIQGKRLTSEAEMDIVDMGLAGLVNTRILRRAQQTGLRAIGLSGVDAGLFEARSVAPSDNNRTGSISAVDQRVIIDLCSLGYLPIVSSVSMDSNDKAGLNINADDAAMALAVALKAEFLIYLSDIQGVLKDGQVIPLLDQTRSHAEIEAGVIAGGMIPKVQGSLDAVRQGVGSVLIGAFEKPGDLRAFRSGTRGTRISESSQD